MTFIMSYLQFFLFLAGPPQDAALFAGVSRRPLNGRFSRRRFDLIVLLYSDSAISLQWLQICSYFGKVAN